MKFQYPDTYYFLTDWLLRRTSHTGVRRVVPIDAAVATGVGMVREENQDRAVIVRGKDGRGNGFIAIAVADGIGGMRSGATCAAMTLGAFVSSIAEESRLSPDSALHWVERSVKAADRFVFSEFHGSGGSTLVAIVMKLNQKPCWVSVGDSRIYKISKNSMSQISKDDTIAGQLGKKVDASHDHSRLLQFVGIGNEMEPNLAEIDCSPEDHFLLTTDGAHYLSEIDGLLPKIIKNASDAGMCVKRLIDIAKWCGGTDNATAALASLSEVHAVNSTIRGDYLEVWDAHGEVICYRQQSGNNKQVLADKNPTEARTAHALGQADLNVRLFARDTPGPAFKAVKAARKNSGKAKLLKAKRQKPDLNESAAMAPQLLVEFSKKKD